MMTEAKSKNFQPFLKTLEHTLGEFCCQKATLRPSSYKEDHQNLKERSGGDRETLAGPQLFQPLQMMNQIYEKRANLGHNHTELSDGTSLTDT